MEMRRHYLILLLAWVGLVGAAPSRTCTYTAGQVIEPTCVSENEDNIFSYLSAGVDTIRDGFVVEADLASSSVSAAKLGTGAVTTTGILDNTITTTDINATLTFADSDLIDLSAINGSTTTEGLKLPQNTVCSSATAEGQVCWDSDSDTLSVGTGAGVQTLGTGSGDITAVYGCTTGNCTSITAADGALLSFASVNTSGTGEGIILPQNTSCSSGTAEGQICWDSNSDALEIGNGTTTTAIGTGDITDVYNCGSGDCGSLTATDGDVLNFAAVNNSSVSEGIRLPQATSCTAGTAEGQICWDTDDDVLRVGNATTTTAIGSGDITDVFSCATGDCASIALADGDFLDMSLVNTSGTSEGLKLPQATSCSSGTAEGQLCWDTDDDQLYSGTGSTATSLKSNQKIGSFTRDTTTASGTQAVTGVGFQPRVVVFFAAQHAAVGEMSVGVDDGTSALSVSDQYNVTANTWGNNTGESLADYESSTAFYQGAISSLDSDGFTVTWTKTGSPTGTFTVRYLALR